MVKIEFAEFKGIYKILWLRYVSGVDLSQHCMKSLLGSNDRRVYPFMKKVWNLELKDAPYYYLCGVDLNFDWRKNLHLAFRYSCGEVLEVDNEFIRCRIINARRMEISERFIDWSLPQSHNKYFNTCRNWWFANMIARNPGTRKPPVQGNLFG